MVTLTMSKATGRCDGCGCKTDQYGLEFADAHGCVLFMCRKSLMQEIEMLLPPQTGTGDERQAEPKLDNFPAS